jgi:hypothetical protein
MLQRDLLSFSPTLNSHHRESCEHMVVRLSLNRRTRSLLSEVFFFNMLFIHIHGRIWGSPTIRTIKRYKQRVEYPRNSKFKAIESERIILGDCKMSAICWQFASTRLNASRLVGYWSDGRRGVTQPWSCIVSSNTYHSTCNWNSPCQEQSGRGRYRSPLSRSDSQKLMSQSNLKPKEITNQLGIHRKQNYWPVSERVLFGPNDDSFYSRLLPTYFQKCLRY